MEKYPQGFSPRFRLINHIEKKEFSGILRNHQRSFINPEIIHLCLKIPITRMSRDIVYSIKGIVSQDEYLLEGLEYWIQYFLYEC